MERDSFIFYKSFYEAITDLPKDIRLEVLTAIIEYGLYGREPENLKPLARGMFTLVRPNLDANTARYVNGSKGGRKSAKKKAEASKAYALTYEQEIEIMRNDNDWKQTICADFNISADEYSTRLTRFLTHCREDSKKKGRDGHDSDEDAKSHLRYWMTKAFPVGTSPATQSKQRSDRNDNPPAPMDYTGRLQAIAQQQEQREQEWAKREAEKVSPDDLIRRMGYDPSEVTLAQALNPQWREKNPPSSAP